MAVNPAQYIKNLTKSITYSTLDITKNYMPAGQELIDTNAQVFKEVYNTIKQPKTSMKKLSALIKGSKLYEAGEIGFKATIEDLKTGNFYNQERINALETKAGGSLLDMSDMEIDYDELDKDINGDFDTDFDFDDNLDITEGDAYIGEMIAETSMASAQSISKTVASSSKYIADSHRATSTLMYNLNMKGFEAVNKGVLSVNQNVSQILEFTTTTIKDYMEKTLKSQDRLLKLQEEQTVLLKNIHDMQAELHPKKGSNNRTGKANRYGDVVAANGMLDVKAYMKMVYGNIMNETGLKQFADMNSAMGGGNLLLTFMGSPLKFLTDGLVKKIIPDIVKKSMEGFNQTLSGFFSSLLFRITSLKGEEDNPLLNWIGKLFGINNRVKTTIDPSKYEKGPVPFDGITRKAIIEVIPGYLARIESALTGKDERVMDYQKGTWVNHGELKRKRKELYKSYVDSTSSEMKESFKEFSKSIDFGSATDADKFYKDMDKFFEIIYKGNDPFSKNASEKFADIDRNNFRILKQMWKSSPRAYQMSFYGRVLESRQRQDQMMKDLEERGDSIERLAYTNAGTLNRYNERGDLLKNKTGQKMNSLINQRDKFQKNIFDYLREQLRQLIILNQNDFSGTEGESSTETDSAVNYYSFFGTEKIEKSETDRSLDQIDKELESLRKKAKKEGLTLLDYQKLYELNDDEKSGNSQLDNYGRRFDEIRKKKEAKDNEKKRSFFSELFDLEDKDGKKVSKFDVVKRYLKKPGELVAKVFNTADKRLYDLIFGKPDELYKLGGKDPKSILQMMKVKFDDFFEQLSEKLKQIFDPIISRVKDFFKDKLGKLKDFLFNKDTGKLKTFTSGAKETFKSAFNWTKNSFRETKDEIKSIFNIGSDDGYGVPTVDWEYSPRQKELLGYADGARTIGKSGLAVLSEGEMVIPQHLNPFYKGKRSSREELVKKEKRIKNSAVSKFASLVGSKLPSFESGTRSVNKDDIDDAVFTREQWNSFTPDELKRAIMVRYGEKRERNLGEAALYTVGSGLKRFMNELIGDPKDIKINVANTSNELFNRAYKEVMGNKADFLGRGLAGAAIGLGGSILTGGIIPPFLGASIGSAVSLTKSSEGIKNWLFGTEENGELKKGVLPQGLVSWIKKYIPSMAKYGSVGGLLGLLPIVPGGPVAGLILGSTIGYMKNNENLQRELFGDDIVEGFGKFKQSLKKKLPSILGGAGVGAAAGLILGGPFGLIGNMALGGGIGLLSTTERFQDIMYGKEVNGKRQGGLVGELKKSVIDPLGKWIKKQGKDLRSWFKDNVLEPIKGAIQPILKQMELMVKGIGKGVTNFLNKMFERSLGIPLHRFITEKFVKPFSKVFNGLFNIAKLPFKLALGGPAKLIGGIGNKLRDRQVKRGTANYMTAQERLDWSRKRGLGDRGAYGKLDEALATMDSQELDAFLNTTSDFSNYLGEVKSNKLKTKGDFVGALEGQMGSEQYKIKDIKKIRKLVQKGEMEKARSLLNDSVLSGADSKILRRLFRFKTDSPENKQKILDILDNQGAAFEESLNKKGETFKQAENYFLRLAGGDRKLARKFMNDKAKIKEVQDLIRKEKSSRDPGKEAAERAQEENKEYQNTVKENVESLKTSVAKIADYFTNPEFRATVDNSLEKKKKELKRNKKQKHTLFTENGPVSFVRDGEKDDWNEDLSDDTTKETLNEEKREDSEVSKIASFTDRIKNFFKKGKKEDGEKKGGLFSKLGSILKGGAGLLGGLFKGLTKGGGGLLGGLLGGAGALLTKIPHLGIPIAIISALGLLGGTETGNKIINGLPNLVSKGAGLLENAVFKIVDGLGKGITGILQGAPAIINSLAGVVPNIVGSIVGQIPVVISALSNNLPNIISSLIAATPSIGKALIGGIWSIIKSIPDILGAVVGGVGSGIKNGIMGLINGDTDKDVETMNSYAAMGSNPYAYGYTGTNDYYSQNYSNEYTNPYSTTYTVDENYNEFVDQTSSSNNLERGAVSAISAFRASKLNNPTNIFDKIQKKSFNLSAKFGSKLLSPIKKRNEKRITKKIEKKNKKLFEQLKRAEEKRGKSPTISDIVKKKSDSILKSIREKLLSFAKNSIVAKKLGEKGAKAFLEKSIPQIMKTVSSKIATAGAKLGASFLSGGVFNVILAAYGFIDGMTDAERILGITETPTTGQRLIAGLCSAINEFILFGLIPDKILVDIFMSTIGKILGIDDELKTQQEAAELEVSNYNQEHGTNYTVTEYQNEVKDQDGGLLTRAWKKIKNFFKGGSKSETNTRLGMTGGGSNLSGSGSGMAPIISQVDKRIANKKFGNSTVGESGCAPSTAAMVLNNMNNQVDINDTMKNAVAFQKEDGSVDSRYFSNIFSKYGYKTEYSDKQSEALNSIYNGEQVILLGQDSSNTSKAKSPFGITPHYVVATQMSKDGKILISDPETNGQKYYDKSILDNVQLTVKAKNNKSGSGSSRRFGLLLRSGSGQYLNDAQRNVNKRFVYEFLINQMGFSTAGAIGIMANIQRESQYNPAAQVVDTNGKISRGICQWNAGRGDNLVTFCKNRGKSATDLESQLLFLKSELGAKSYSKLVGFIVSVKNTKDGALSAANEFLMVFERPNKNYLSQINKITKENIDMLWSEFGGAKVPANSSIASTVNASMTFSTDSSSSSLSGSSETTEDNSFIGKLLGHFTDKITYMTTGVLPGQEGSMSSDFSSGAYGSSVNSNARGAKNWFLETLKGSRVSSEYGSKDAVRDYKAHGGMDFAAPGGTPIYTPVSGTVEASQFGSSYGNHVIIRDSAGYKHYFAHMQELSKLSVGAKVTKGEQVGIVGTTGHSTGNHLHYEVRDPSNNRTNPDVYLENYSGGSSGIVSPLKNYEDKKFRVDKNGGKGGGETSIDEKLLQAIVSILVKILDDTNNLAQIKTLLAEYFGAGKELASAKKGSEAATKAKERFNTAKNNIYNIVQNKGNEEDGAISQKETLLKQLQLLMSE